MSLDSIPDASAGRAEDETPRRGSKASPDRLAELEARVASLEAREFVADKAELSRLGNRIERVFRALIGCTSNGAISSLEEKGARILKSVRSDIRPGIIEDNAK